MNEYEARAWNAALDAAIKAYPNGIGAIHSLRARYAITVEHIGRSTKQEVVEIGEENG